VAAVLESSAWDSDELELPAAKSIYESMSALGQKLPRAARLWIKMFHRVLRVPTSGAGDATGRCLYGTDNRFGSLTAAAQSKWLSALAPKAAAAVADRRVRFGPEADIAAPFSGTGIGIGLVSRERGSP
jgi:hypothetical protein